MSLLNVQFDCIRLFKGLTRPDCRRLYAALFASGLKVPACKAGFGVQPVSWTYLFGQGVRQTVSCQGRISGWFTVRDNLLNRMD